MEKKLELPFQFGTIQEIISKAKDLSLQNEGADVSTEFNGVNLHINSGTDADLLWRDIKTAWLIKWEMVGPTPLLEYPPALSETIAQKQKELDDRYEIQREEQEAKDKSEKNLFESKVAGIELSLIDKDGWAKGLANNSDGYGSGIYAYADGWARLMQVEIAQGKILEDIAGAASHALGFMGITGFMYGAAVSILSMAWEHGEKLKNWHNRKYGQPESEGVVNPAIITLKS